MESIKKDLKHWEAKFKIARVGNVSKDYYYSAGMCDGLALAMKRIKKRITVTDVCDCDRPQWVQTVPFKCKKCNGLAYTKKTQR